MNDSVKDCSHPPCVQKNGKHTPVPEDFVPVSPMGTEGYIWTDDDFPPEDPEENAAK